MPLGNWTKEIELKEIGHMFESIIFGINMCISLSLNLIENPTSVRIDFHLFIFVL